MDQQKWFTLAAETAYSPRHVALELYELHGWKYAESLFLEGDITEAYLLERCGVYCVALRGSDEPLDWFLRNLWIKSGYTLQGDCHGGILDAANAVYRVVRAHISRIEKEPQRIVFCGHSLGGAAAVLLAALVVTDLREKGWSVRPEVLALGAPPVCSPTLASWILTEIDVTSVALPSDPVPAIRPIFSNWITPGQPIPAIPWGTCGDWLRCHQFDYWN